MTQASTQASPFIQTPGWLAFHPDPSRPQLTLPDGAVDAHCHVFGPGQRFPYAPERKYTPCDAPKETLFALRDHLGLARNVIVQASCHGRDNRALLDALQTAGERARGVVAATPDVDDVTLQHMHDAGVRGVRFNFLKRLVGHTSPDVLHAMAERIKPMGWHIVVYFEADDLAQLMPALTTLPVVVVIDHMGRPNVGKSVKDPDFQAFMTMMAHHEHIWTKVSCPERLSKTGPAALHGEPRAYRDVIPFARQLVERFPERVLWGTDWPHPNLSSHMPDDGLLVDHIAHIAPTPALRQALLVDNPDRLYWH